MILRSVIDSQNTKIKKIYFNQNYLTNKAALVAAEVIADKTLKVKEIGLKWNKITAIGGNEIAKALEDNQELKVLDLSWNAIGIRQNGKRTK